ncbi:MAG: hypothetical protein HY474_01480 [Candidatus Sungbacteria bacterium]|uniref:TrpR like protein, YerC/YecD n=1 Tax=Candidatus Sungiibacteriota bacterium TaxID=2750080 RepID=A0A933DRF5_9BACT|nr:hypothetical protein [Candidatus Sungbacteria bacterium]
MAKFAEKLSRKERDQLLFEFFRGLGMVRGTEEVAKVFGDLVSRQELEMIAKRLKIATLLIEDKTYDEIRRHMKVSAPTIARVSAWLQQAGEGFRLLHARVKRAGGEVTRIHTPLQRKYPLYFWPQLLMQEISRIATERQRAKLLDVIDDFDHKTKLYKELRKSLSYPRT